MAVRAPDPAFPLDTGTVDAATQYEAYLDWCAQQGTPADQRILGEK